MNRTWNRIVGVAAIMVVLALLVSTSFLTQHQEKFRSRYDEERLKNDSLMGTVQALQKQLREQEQELRAKNSLVDSLTQVCINPEASSSTRE